MLNLPEDFWIYNEEPVDEIQLGGTMKSIRRDVADGRMSPEEAYSEIDNHYVDLIEYDDKDFEVPVEGEEHVWACLERQRDVGGCVQPMDLFPVNYDNAMGVGVLDAALETGTSHMLSDVAGRLRSELQDIMMEIDIHPDKRSMVANLDDETIMVIARVLLEPDVEV
jgi:hypothetical protein